MSDFALILNPVEGHGGYVATARCSPADETTLEGSVEAHADGPNVLAIQPTAEDATQHHVAASHGNTVADTNFIPAHAARGPVFRPGLFLPGLSRQEISNVNAVPGQNASGDFLSFQSGVLRPAGSHGAAVAASSSNERGSIDRSANLQPPPPGRRLRRVDRLPPCPSLARIDPYRNRADELIYRHRLFDVGYLRRFLTPSGYVLGTTPVDHLSAWELHKQARSAAEDWMRARTKHIIDNIGAEYRGPHLAEIKDSFDRGLRFDRFVFEQRCKIYTAFKRMPSDQQLDLAPETPTYAQPLASFQQHGYHHDRTGMVDPVHVVPRRAYQPSSPALPPVPVLQRPLFDRTVSPDTVAVATNAQSHVSAGHQPYAYSGRRVAQGGHYSEGHDAVLGTGYTPVGQRFSQHVVPRGACPAEHGTPAPANAYMSVPAAAQPRRRSGETRLWHADGLRNIPQPGLPLSDAVMKVNRDVGKGMGGDGSPPEAEALDSKENAVEEKVPIAAMSSQRESTNPYATHLHRLNPQQMQALRRLGAGTPNARMTSGDRGGSSMAEANVNFLLDLHARRSAAPSPKTPSPAGTQQDNAVASKKRAAEEAPDDSKGEDDGLKKDDGRAAKKGSGADEEQRKGVARRIAKKARRPNVEYKEPEYKEAEYDSDDGVAFRN